MASVFLCEDERLGREVAIKRLHGETPVPDGASRFEREARLGASLNHPGLVAVFDTVPDDEGDLIVMEYVPGESLADALKRGPLSSERAVAVVSALAAALDHAHARGVLHRDIKPGNVLLRDDGVVKLADLGIATAAEQTRITKSGTVLGTAGYMSPEQLQGEEAEIRSDVYSLAVVAFEALAGKKARPGSTPLEVAHQIATAPPPDLREAWPDAPPAAAETLARGMARHPRDRPTSAGELAAGLRRAFEQPTTRTTRQVASWAARPELGPVSRSMGENRRAPRWLPAAGLAAVVAAVIALIAVGGGGDRAGNDSSGRAGGHPADEAKPKDRAEAQPAPAPEPAAEEPAAEADAEPVSGGGETSGAALNAEGFELMQAGRYDEAIPVLERAVAAFPEGTTDLNYAYALYNLGRSLRLAGRPDEAVPILERRLEIPNQTDTVRRELELARRSSMDP